MTMDGDEFARCLTRFSWGERLQFRLALFLMDWNLLAPLRWCGWADLDDVCLNDEEEGCWTFLRRLGRDEALYIQLQPARTGGFFMRLGKCDHYEFR